MLQNSRAGWKLTLQNGRAGLKSDVTKWQSWFKKWCYKIAELVKNWRYKMILGLNFYYFIYLYSTRVSDLIFPAGDWWWYLNNLQPWQNAAQIHFKVGSKARIETYARPVKKMVGLISISLLRRQAMNSALQSPLKSSECDETIYTIYPRNTLEDGILHSSEVQIKSRLPRRILVMAWGGWSLLL